jgi:ribonuclease-3
MDMVHCRAAGADRGTVLIAPATSEWLASLTGCAILDPDLYSRALTHGSASADNYERLEFLGDRVLGMVMAEWLYDLFPGEKEGQLSRRLNALVTGPVCAEIARECGLRPHMQLGKQARDDGALDSDNVLGDVMEAVIGALYRDQGMEAARALIRRLWDSRMSGAASAPKHPKSALQEWAAANRRKPPVYSLVSRCGPDHSLKFRVSVAIAGIGEAEADGSSKQEAETAAAAALLEQIS